MAVSLVLTVMQMSLIVLGSHRKSSEIIGSRSRRRSSEVASRGRTSAVGSRRSIKEGYLSCCYTIVKHEHICVNEEVKSDMW